MKVRIVLTDILSTAGAMTSNHLGGRVSGERLSHERIYSELVMREYDVFNGFCWT